ncbi:NUDIX hydrolase [Catalinimonas niigatensis]|uniref:NUDIX hydrolase n=1 Tax=Catalinimonas niigatensis TaxID=1397264 RepID=UPI002666CFAF|nr:CoA pyrophosphatase [Catalinimonas niigatensis]WPP51359.1 CoA pyrophosphatase [Catalinimonas niigatensis]
MKGIKNALKNRLDKGLPGWQAHLRMSTSVHQNARISPPQRTRKAAVLILLFPNQDEWWLPLILRPTYDGVHSGQMALPGGKVEPEDQDLIATALRETYEEIGVRVDRDQVVGVLSDLYIPPSNITVTPVLAICSQVPRYYPDPNEVAGITEVSIYDLQHPENYLIKEIQVFNGSLLKAPSFQIQGKTIWGATAMMLSELLFIMKEID